MISNVAPKSTEAVGSNAPATGESADAGDTGEFDALLALHSMVGEDTVTEVSAQMAGTLEGMEFPAALDDAEDSEEGDALPDDALAFLAALLPLPQKALPAAAVENSAVPIQNDAGSAGAGSAASGATPGVTGAGTDDLVQAFASNLADATGKDSKPAANAVAAPTTDATQWNYMGGPAEMFAHAARHTAERQSASLTTHVRDPRWADDLGNRLASMVRTGESSASLQLTPVDLGPLEVNVSVRDQQATVHFGAANAETRALLEASIPRLREMLAAQGFQLMDSSVSHGFARSTRHESAGTPRVNEIGESPTVAAAATHITGLLDLYA
jgi:flagellar hook-length control protein FliK